MLFKINQLRARHQAPPVHISAYRTANNSDQFDVPINFFKDTPPMSYHSSVKQYVTNQTARVPLKVTISVDDVARAWYLEPAKKYYDYGREPANFGANELHNSFVQLVWKSAKSVKILCSFTHVLGHGVVLTHTVIDAEMDPMTNVKGQFASNVLPPIDI